MPSIRKLPFVAWILKLPFVAWILKLPFVGRIFWKVLAAVAILVPAAWYLIPKFIDYEITPADYGGSAISGLIFAYLIHLWLLPVEEPASDEEE